MMRIDFKILNVLLVLYLPGVNADADVAKPIFSRSECIVKIKLIWEGEITDSKKEEILISIGSNIGRSIAEGYSLPRPSIAYRGVNKEYLYFQYREQCDKKDEITNQLLTSHVAPNVVGFPAYHITDEIVFPSANTIEIYGPYWTDGGE